MCSVCQEHDYIACFEFPFSDVYLRGAHTEYRCQNISVGMCKYLLLGYLTFIAKSLCFGMILGQNVKLLIPQQIGPAVTGVCRNQSSIGTNGGQIK